VPFESTPARNSLRGRPTCRAFESNVPAVRAGGHLIHGIYRGSEKTTRLLRRDITIRNVRDPGRPGAGHPGSSPQPQVGRLVRQFDGSFNFFGRAGGSDGISNFPMTDSRRCFWPSAEINWDGHNRMVSVVKGEKSPPGKENNFRADISKKTSGGGGSRTRRALPSETTKVQVNAIFRNPCFVCLTAGCIHRKESPSR